MLAEASDLSVSVQSNSPRGAGISLEKALCLYACRQVNRGGRPCGWTDWWAPVTKSEVGAASWKTVCELLRVHTSERNKANRTEANYTLESGGGGKIRGKQLFQHRLHYTLLFRWLGLMQSRDKMIQAHILFCGTKLTASSLYLLFLLKVKWRESALTQPTPVRCWRGALWRTITPYRSMWKRWIFQAAAWKACSEKNNKQQAIWICHNIHDSSLVVFVSIQPPAADLCRELHPVHQKLCHFPFIWCYKVMKLIRVN